MKSNLLVTTAALALMISAGAHAQTRSDTKPDQPAASQSHGERGSATKEMNRDSTRKTERTKDGTTTGQSSPSTAGSTSSDNKAASDSKPDKGKPAAPQDSTSPSHSNAAQSTPNGKAGDKTGDKASTTSSDKASDKANAARQDDKSSTSTRSTQSNEPSSTKSNTAGQAGTRQPSAAQRDTTTDRNQATTNSKSGDTNSAAATDSKSATRVSASLQTEQKTRLHREITKLDAKPVTNVNFSVSVGTAVPRTVSLHRVPTTIVEIVPQYRGYDYFVVRDQVVIVQPETHKIVDVIERTGGSSRASVTTTREKRVKLSEKQRSYIRQHAGSRRTTTTTTTTGSAPRQQTIVVGEEVPSSVEIESFPEDVYREVPTVREYRYIRSGSDVYLVDPGSRRVIEEIE